MSSMSEGYGDDDYEPSDIDIEESLVISVKTREDVINFPATATARSDAMEVKLDCNIDFDREPPLFDVIAPSPGENPYGEGVYSYEIADDAVRFDLRQIPALLPDLRSLNLECNGLNGSFPSFFSLRNLENLNVSHNMFLDLKLQALPVAFPNLKWLDCYMCDGLTGDLKMLAPYTHQLRKLILYGTDVTGHVLDIAGFTKLHSFSMSETRIKGTMRDVRVAGLLRCRRLSIAGLDPDEDDEQLPPGE